MLCFESGKTELPIQQQTFISAQTVALHWQLQNVKEKRVLKCTLVAGTELS